jgi:hypothetical protein
MESHAEIFSVRAAILAATAAQVRSADRHAQKRKNTKQSQ